MSTHECPPDHRHAETGTCWSQHGCRCDPCGVRERARVMDAYRFRRDVAGGDQLIPAIGVVRRVEALAVLGWSGRDVAARAGVSRAHLQQTRAGHFATVLASTHQKIDTVYRELMWTICDTNGSKWTRALAAKAGYAPPAAWDDIDNPRERPKFGALKNNGPKYEDPTLIANG